MKFRSITWGIIAVMMVIGALGIASTQTCTPQAISDSQFLMGTLVELRIFGSQKAMDAAVKDLAQITGQRPVITTASKSIAAFKVREGMKIGCKVTLRGDRMYDFFNKLVNVVLPRVRDFRGISPRAFDGRGNYTLGLREQVIFPEIDYDEIDKVRGMDITIVTTAKTDEEARELLKMMGMPFRE